MTTTVALILAAGQGSRFRAAAGPDQNKLLAPCQGLTDCLLPVLEHALINLADCVPRRILITRPDSPEIITLARTYDCEVLTIASAGMGDSLAAGVAASAEAAGWLVLLGDMPFIQPATLEAVLAAMAEDRIAVPVGPQGFGHPVGFGRSLGSALQALSGDQGARRLFAGQQVIEVATGDLGIYRDIDIPANLL